MSNAEDDAAFCERVLGGEQAVDERAALARFRARRVPRRISMPVRWMGGLAAAIVIVALLASTPLRSVAQNFLTIFQPQTVAPLDISALKLDGRLLPNLTEFGTLFDRHGEKPREVAGAAAASRSAGFRVLAPSVIPEQIGGTSRVVYDPRMSQSFRFSAAKARAAATRDKRPLPAMPAHLDGATVTASIGPTIVQTWGVHAKQGGGSMMVVAQGLAPVVRSSGASLPELESYLLSMPGVTPELADQIRAIGNASALPIPFMPTKQTAQTVTVHGVSGLEIGDNTGLGAGVVWQEDGKIYAVFGTLTQSEVLDVANSLR
jgi:hypothetical protein